MAFIYVFVQDPNLDFIKVGFSGDPEVRVQAFKTVLPRGTLLESFETLGGPEIEGHVFEALERAGFRRAGTEVFETKLEERGRALTVVRDAVASYQVKCGWCRRAGIDRPKDHAHSLSELFDARP